MSVADNIFENLSSGHQYYNPDDFSLTTPILAPVLFLFSITQL
jgi:hypothetical protein